MKKSVSPNNPCPFLRAMAAYGYLEERAEKLLRVASVLSRVGGKTRAEGKLPRGLLFAIALIANGLGPARLMKSLFGGLDVEKLRNGPLDKLGVGSGIIGKDGVIDQKELARLDEFSIDALDSETKKHERGLTLAQITKMMDANFARAEGRRRKIDRALMDGEWPVLLAVMGKGVGPDRYLSLAELHELFLEQTLPKRVLERINASPR